MQSLYARHTLPVELQHQSCNSLNFFKTPTGEPTVTLIAHIIIESQCLTLRETIWKSLLFPHIPPTTNHQIGLSAVCSQESLRQQSRALQNEQERFCSDRSEHARAEEE